MYRIASILVFFLWLTVGCSLREPSQPAHPVFDELDGRKLGINFANQLHPTKDFNVFDYMYFYNGSGVGIGDFNNDGKPDLYFAANQVPGRMFLNTGKWSFRDVTAQTGIPQDSAWSTGVSVVDINGDGLLDLYICRVGRLNGLPQSHNQFLVCQGIRDGVPYYKDMAPAWGLDFSGLSTQAAFLDYDGDGDLDLYLVNHSLHQNGTFGIRKEKLQETSPISGDRLFRNDGDHFTDVTKAAGIFSSVIGYGLGVCVSDINLDGYPDIYVCNDFHENDYLYINQRNGTFRESGLDMMMHTSQFSMGVDISDVNNDGKPDILTTDMLPYDPYILKRSEGEDTWDIFNMKIGYGYDYQYTRNNFQFNRGNGNFSEIGLYSGIAATDWSWSPLWLDFDNDGRKDLFISNGIPKRLNDIDYIDFISNQELQEKMRTSGLDNKDMDLIDKFPQIRLPSKFFRNAGDLRFDDMQHEIAHSKAGYLNGAACADFDGDGGVDIVANCVDDAPVIFRNTINDSSVSRSVAISLKGPTRNINALGAKLILFCGDEKRLYEKYPVHGFMSSSETPLYVGLAKTKIDSAFLIWPDNGFQRVSITAEQHKMQFIYQAGLPKFNYALLDQPADPALRIVTDITANTGLGQKIPENSFHEFDREPLIPHMLSTEGPAVAIADINHDGREDVFLGSAKWNKSHIYLQGPDGRFSMSSQPAIELDSSCEDVGAVFADLNGDGNLDLAVASGGNEFFGKDSNLAPRIYYGDGRGGFSKAQNPFDSIYLNAACVVAMDFDGDGKTDLFFGGRSVPWEYGNIPRSYLLRNDGNGKFTDITEKLCPGLARVGFVTSAIAADMDGDGYQDLVVACEWGGISVFLNRPGRYLRQEVTAKKGWWNFVYVTDLNLDGRPDIVAGNLGWNSRLHASEDQPVRMYYADFDDNGKKEQVLTYYLNDREICFANKAELEKQLPRLRKKFLYAEDFAKASLTDIFSADKLKSADVFQANYFANAIFLNRGGGRFDLETMPWEAQLAPFKAAVEVDANNDSLPDLFLVGNYYDNNIQMGRYDADYGTMLINRGGGTFKTESPQGLILKGSCRHIAPIIIQGRRAFLVVRNNESPVVYEFGQRKDSRSVQRKTGK